MKIEDVRSIAKSNGVSPGKLRKPDLIRSIQVCGGRLFRNRAQCRMRSATLSLACCRFNAAKQGEPS